MFTFISIHFDWTRLKQMGSTRQQRGKEDQHSSYFSWNLDNFWILITQNVDKTHEKSTAHFYCLRNWKIVRAKGLRLARYGEVVENTLQNKAKQKLAFFYFLIPTISNANQLCHRYAIRLVKTIFFSMALNTWFAWKMCVLLTMANI